MRLIDADDFLDLFYVASAGQDKEFIKTVEAVAEDTPTIDPVHAAGGCYCRECEYRGTEACPMCHEERFDDEEDGLDFILHNNATDENGFCSYGRREESRCEKD